MKCLHCGGAGRALRLWRCYRTEECLQNACMRALFVSFQNASRGSIPHGRVNSNAGSQLGRCQSQPDNLIITLSVITCQPCQEPASHEHYSNAEARTAFEHDTGHRVQPPASHGTEELYPTRDESQKPCVREFHDFPQPYPRFLVGESRQH